MLIELACPNCQNAINPQDHGKHVNCDACGSHFILDGHFCANCNAYYKEGVGFCQECGSAMNRVCHKCHTKNWAGDEHCKNCGGAMDIFQLLHMQNNQATAERIEEQKRFAREIKEKEKIDSAKRTVYLEEIERERLMKIAARRQVQKKKDQQLYMIVGAVLIFAVLLMAFGFLFTL